MSEDWESYFWRGKKEKKEKGAPPSLFQEFGGGVRLFRSRRTHNRGVSFFLQYPPVPVQHFVFVFKTIPDNSSSLNSSFSFSTYVLLYHLRRGSTKCPKAPNQTEKIFLSLSPFMLLCLNSQKETKRREKERNKKLYTRPSTPGLHHLTISVRAFADALQSRHSNRLWKRFLWCFLLFPP